MNPRLRNGLAADEHDDDGPLRCVGDGLHELYLRAHEPEV